VFNVFVDTDEALHGRVREGDMRAFDLLYARYESRLFGFLLGMLKNRADAEDVFHVAFMRTLERSTVTLDHEGAFRCWLYRVARNAALNHQRSDRRGARAIAQIPESDAPPRADEELGERELLHALDGAVERLPESLSEVFHLRSSGLSYEEIADVLEIPVGTLKSRMNQMVTQLREELRPWTAR
jgi:RNA polymerase sigma-70 factor (ECF subfamily)